MTARARRPCPVCGGKRRRVVYQQRFMDGPMGGGYDVAVCGRCGAGFADGIPPQAEMDRYYTEQSKYTTYDQENQSESPWDLARFQATTDQITPHLKSRDVRILDIGCATGGLLSVFKRSGFRNAIGVDPSPDCATAAARLHGVTVRTSTLAQLAFWKDRFDLVLMVGVLEHLREAKEAVRIAADLLTNGGLIYVAVPDVAGLASCPNAPYQQFSVEHVNFFSTTSLGRLMAGCGLADVHTWTWVLEWRERVFEPILGGLYERAPLPQHQAFDEITEAALERYLSFSRAADQGIISLLKSLKMSQEPIIVWGAGTLARRLLATTRFAEANIVAFVDSNPHNQGKVLASRPILHPKDIVGRNERILICSVSFAKEIASAIRRKYRLRNRIITLAD